MKRLFCVLCALFLCLALPAVAEEPLASSSIDTAYCGTWEMSGYQYEDGVTALYSPGTSPWVLELNPDGSATIHNEFQTLEGTWSVLSGDGSKYIHVEIEGLGAEDEYDFVEHNGDLIQAEGGMIFHSGSPDPEVKPAPPYPQSKYAPIQTFNGTWEVTGGLLTVSQLGISQPYSAKDLFPDVEGPVRVVIQNGQFVAASLQKSGDKEPYPVRYIYHGNAIHCYLPNADMPCVTCYYVGADTLHMFSYAPSNSSGVSVEFVLVLIKVK